MKKENHISMMAELAQSEGGVFTSAQALRLGIPRDALSYATRAGRVERLVRGAYRFVGAPPSELDLARAVWKLTDPGKFTHERLASWDGVCVGGQTAAFALGIGDLYPYPCRIYAPHLMRTKLPEASMAIRRVDEGDVTFRLGFPITRSERTILDLALDGEDVSLVLDALGDAMRRLPQPAEFDRLRLCNLLEGSTGRWGVPRGMAGELIEAMGCSPMV